MRLIDSDAEVYGYVETWICDCSGFGRQSVMAVEDISYLPEIAPETLPIVQELRKELERDEMATLCGKLVVLCDQPREKWKEVFLKYRGSMIGDYMGSGYPFVDAFNRIYDEFIYISSDGAYKLVKETAEKEFLSIKSKRKPSETK